MDTRAEIKSLAMEYDWLLENCVLPTLEQVLKNLKLAMGKLPALNYGDADAIQKQNGERYVLICNESDTKCLASVYGESITSLEVNLKNSKSTSGGTLKYAMNSIFRLKQLEDAFDHLKVASTSLEDTLSERKSISQEEDLLDILYCLNLSISRAYLNLVNPPAGNLKIPPTNFVPTLPPDVEAQAFIQDLRLCLKFVYTQGNASKFEQLFYVPMPHMTKIYYLLSVMEQVLQHQIQDKIHLLRPWKKQVERKEHLATKPKF